MARVTKRMGARSSRLPWPHIPEMSDLLGIDPAVYRQINAALASGKRHIMLYGPPGTGKTTLARHVATVLTGGKWTLVTGSSDWGFARHHRGLSACRWRIGGFRSRNSAAPL